MTCLMSTPKLFRKNGKRDSCIIDKVCQALEHWRICCRRLRIHPRIPLRVALIHMLEHRRAFLAVKLRRVGTRQAGIEDVLDGQLELRTGGGFLPPVKH